MTRFSAEQWRQIRILFERLSEQDSNSWDAELADVEPIVRQQTLNMLRAQHSGRLAPSAAEQGPELAVDRESRRGERVGQYELMALLGAGGMGEVFKARRAIGDYKQTVAIKFLAASISTFQQRFERERQLLAQLEHENIARLLDGGTVQGQPYLVMEYIDGEQIERYCEQHKLTAELRIDLLLQVAKAVAVAHSQLIVHRDIKPDNVLVTAQGQAKLMDFGIAALVDMEGNADVTQSGLMTPTAAAPEQVRGERTTIATDIFQLGLLGYRLLTGTHPFDGEGSEPQTPLTQRLLGGAPRPLRAALTDLAVARPQDLEAILAKALADEPQQRYHSAAALIDDLENWRGKRPVQARAQTFWTIAWRWVMRNRLASGGVLAAVLSLVLGSGLALWQAREARQQLVVAERNAQEANAVADFLNRIFRSANTFESQGEEPTATELLANGVGLIETDLAEQPLLQARLLLTMGVTYRSRSAHEPAKALIQRAIDLLREHRAPIEDVAEGLGELAWVETYQENFDRAKSLLLEGDALLTAMGDEHAGLRGRLLQRLIVVEINREDLPAATSAAIAALDQYRLQRPVDHQRLATVLSLQGTIAREQGNLELALAAYSDALVAKREAYGPSHHSVALTIANIATVEYERRNFEHATTLYRESIAIDEIFFGDPKHFQLFTSWRGLAKAQQGLGELEQAAQSFRIALEILLSNRDESYSYTQQVRVELAEQLWLQGQFDEAVTVQANAAQLLARNEDAAWRCRAQGLTAAGLWHQRGVLSRSSGDCVNSIRMDWQWRSRAIRAISQPEARQHWHEVFAANEVRSHPLFRTSMETIATLESSQQASDSNN